MTAVRFTALGALIFTLSGCPKPTEVSLTPRPDAEPWYPLGESELNPRYDRPIHTGGGRGLVWEQPAATSAARVTDGVLGAALIWAERPGPEPRWRVQLRRWSGEHWLAIAPPVYPDPIPDPDADPDGAPTTLLVVDEKDRPVMAWAGVPTPDGADLSVWRLHGPFWKPLGFPFSQASLDGLAATPAEQLFLSLRKSGESGSEVHRWDGEDWVETAPLPGDGRWQLITDSASRVWAIGPEGGALEARMWSGEDWITTSPLPTPAEAVDHFVLTRDAEGRPHVVQSSSGGLFVARCGLDGIWTGAAATGAALTGPLLAAGFDGAVGLVVAEGVNAPEHKSDAGHERLKLHYWANEDRQTEPWVHTVDAWMSPNDHPTFFTSPGGAPAMAWAGAPETLDSVYTRAWNGAAWASLGGSQGSGGGVSATRSTSDRPQLSRDPYGRIVAVWVEHDLDRGESLKLRRWEGNGWTGVQDLTGELLHGDCPSGPLARISDVAVSYDRRNDPIVHLTGSPSCGEPGAWRIQLERDGWVSEAENFPTVEERIVLTEWDLDEEKYLRVQRRDGELTADFPPLMIQPTFGEVHAALDPDDQPIVSWVGGVTGSLEIYAVRWDGETWVEMAGSATAGGISNSEAPSRKPFVHASADAVCIAWSEAGPGARQIVMRCHVPESDPDYASRP